MGAGAGGAENTESRAADALAGCLGFGRGGGAGSGAVLGTGAGSGAGAGGAATGLCLTDMLRAGWLCAGVLPERALLLGTGLLCGPREA